MRSRRFVRSQKLSVALLISYWRDFKVQEDRKHRKTYKALGDSEQKLQFFSATQIACRLLGSRGYLCQKEKAMFGASIPTKMLCCRMSLANNLQLIWKLN
ncbi:uncharacterized protein LOC133707898 isoform X2 [Rosa rugosa]|uniref:uncharacterized protein LOC133707898 isoform X2 n=1 Tax=Rosa rugosa TaxID=74645 RepID=UPI002B40DA69|nr:uncharacterized protein LOC133707898 isoform X2 [Rosa rugosa]